MLVTFQSFSRKSYISVHSALAMVEFASTAFAENQELAAQVGVTAEELTMLDNLKQVFTAAVPKQLKSWRHAAHCIWKLKT